MEQMLTHDEVLLVVERRTLKEAVATRLQQGQSFLEEVISGRTQMDSWWDRFIDWDRYNETLIGQAFNKASNSHLKRYKRGEGAGAIFPGAYAPPSFSESVESARNEMRFQVRKLRWFYDSIDLLRGSTIERQKMTSTETTSGSMDEYVIQVERLKVMVTSAATNLTTFDQSQEREFSQLRNGLLRQNRFKTVVPKFVLTCSTLKEVRRTMREVSDKWAPREEYIKKEFAPLVSSLIDDPSTLDPVADITEHMDQLKLDLLPKDIQDRGNEMAEVYVYLYCIENSFRIFIADVSIPKSGAVVVKDTSVKCVVVDVLLECGEVRA